MARPGLFYTGTSCLIGQGHLKLKQSMLFYLDITFSAQHVLLFRALCMQVHLTNESLKSGFHLSIESCFLYNTVRFGWISVKVI